MLAAVGAAVAALIECLVASRLQVAGAQLQIVLVLAVVLTVVVGFEAGMTSAFVGGLSVDLLAVRPLGSTVMVLLIAVGIAAAGGRVLSRSRLVGSVAAVFVLTAIYLALTDMLMGILRFSVPPLRPSALLSAAILNAVLGLVVALPMVVVKRRLEARERVVW